MVGTGRKNDARDQTATITIVKRNVPAMAANDVAGERKAEAGAAGLATAGFLHAVERREDLLSIYLGNAGTAVGDADHYLVRAVAQAHRRPAAILDRVVDQIGDRAAERGRTARDRHPVGALVGDRLAGIGEVVAQRLQQARQVDRRPRLRGGVVAGERQGDYKETLTDEEESA